MRIRTGCTDLGRVRVCTSASPPPRPTTRSENKTEAQICLDWRARAARVRVSYLKGLNVNRLLLAIVLPSAPPIIIFQNQRPLTSLLTSHHGTSGGQTFSPRPIQQRYTAPCYWVIWHWHASRRWNETNFYSGSPVRRLRKWALVCYSIVRQRPENELKSPRVVSPISL